MTAARGEWTDPRRACERCMIRRIALWLSLALLGSSCTAQQAYLAANDAASQPRSYQVWQLLDAKTGALVPFDQWIRDASTYDIIYLGEEHHNAAHIEAGLKVLGGLRAQGRQPTLALEMFGWDGQAGLDRFLSDPGVSPEPFLKEARWEDNWGGSFSDYEPLIAFARTNHLAVRALNPPRWLVRRVAKQGLASALTDPDMGRWGMWNQTLVDESAYRDVIIRQVHLCHGGLSEDAYRRMYEASLFRDEGMAKTLTETLGRQTKPDDLLVGPVVSYTGGGHIQYRLPLPNRVERRARRPVKQVTVYMTSFDPERAGDITELLKDGIADYLWLTPVGRDGMPRRCGS